MVIGEGNGGGALVQGARGGVSVGRTALSVAGAGAAGGVGLSAVELAKAYGCRVVAAVSTEEKGEVAKKAGADARKGRKDPGLQLGEGRW